MTVRDETEKALTERSITKISGEPQAEDVTLLVRELAERAAEVATTLGGGEPWAFRTGKVFTTPTYPGVYDINIAANAANAARARAEAEHRALIQQYEVFKGVEKGLKNLIVEAVEEDYLEGLKDDIVGYINVTPLQMIQHLQTTTATLTVVDVSKIKAQ
ncbi:hypothetical protein ACHAWC_005423 [Mediolabrus comicus]